jgi:hypothetical protein
MLQLQLKAPTETRLRTILAQYNDLELFAQNIIAYQISELKKAILNIRFDLIEFEQKYQESSEVFYQKFMAGELDDTEDFMIWAGIYEMLLDNQQQLEAIT